MAFCFPSFLLSRLSIVPGTTNESMGIPAGQKIAVNSPSYLVRKQNAYSLFGRKVKVMKTRQNLLGRTYFTSVGCYDIIPSVKFCLCREYQVKLCYYLYIQFHWGLCSNQPHYSGSIFTGKKENLLPFLCKTFTVLKALNNYYHHF